MKIGIVGSEAAKFTRENEARAHQAIRELLKPGDIVVSGACHLGGIDVWAIEEADALGLVSVQYPPANHQWATGYKPRNQLIAMQSDLVVCITVSELPPGYTGMRFPLCYHCGTPMHVKSGGCWTVKYARAKGKEGSRVIVIEQDEEEAMTAADIKQRLAFMAEGIKVQEGFNWPEYERLCRDALAHIEELERVIQRFAPAGQGRGG